MVKMVAIYEQPEDTSSFDEKYFGEHLEMNAKTPGLIRSEVARFYDLRGGTPKFYVMAEMYFDSKDSLKQALKSPESRAAGEQLQSFASGLVTFHFAELVD